MSALLTKLIGVLMPPFCFILMGILGLVVWRWRPRLGRGLVVASFALLWIASLTVFDGPMHDALGWPEPLDMQAATTAQAIVVLGGGIARHAREYEGADTVNSRTLDRVRYGAWLVRKTGFPLLVSGGLPDRASAAEAELMRAVLEREFGITVRWIEPRSRNTFENARESAQILREAGVGRILLVTDSYHMQRAVQAFAPTGVEVVPAPVNLVNKDPLHFGSFLPSASGLVHNNFFAHEILGRVWYAVRERFE